MTSQTLTYRSVLREIRRLISVATQPDPQTVAALRSLLQQFRLDFLNALDFPVSFFFGFFRIFGKKGEGKGIPNIFFFSSFPFCLFLSHANLFHSRPPPHTHTFD